MLILPMKLLTPIIALSLIGGTTAYAASPNTLPTSPLYPLKRAWEDLTLTFALTPTAKAQVLINQANTMLNEAKALAPQAATNPSIKNTVASTVNDSQTTLNQALNQAKQISDPTKASEIKQEISGQAEQEKQAIETNVEPQAKLEGGDSQAVQKSVDGLNQTSTDATSSGTKSGD